MNANSFTRVFIVNAHEECARKGGAAGAPLGALLWASSQCRDVRRGLRSSSEAVLCGGRRAVRPCGARGLPRFLPTK